MIEPGQIYFADLMDAGRRPVLVVSREGLNRGNYAVVVAFTTGRLPQRKTQLNCVAFRAGEFGLSSDCVAQCKTIASIPIDLLETSTGPLGQLDAPTLRNVIKAIGFVIESECEPE